MVTRYRPIEVDPKTPCTSMALYDLRHTYRHERGNPLTAFFALATHAGHFLKIHFSNVDVVRVLDEFILSTEEQGPDVEGLVAEHFAYTVEDSRFWHSQSETYRDIHKNAIHYRFVTGGACVDVITTVEPQFSLVSSTAG